MSQRRSFRSRISTTFANYVFFGWYQPKSTKTRTFYGVCHSIPQNFNQIHFLLPYLDEFDWSFVECCGELRTMFMFLLTLVDTSRRKHFQKLLKFWIEMIFVGILQMLAIKTFTLLHIFMFFIITRTIVFSYCLQQQDKAEESAFEWSFVECCGCLQR
jgi:hypothetical protein